MWQDGQPLNFTAFLEEPGANFRIPYFSQYFDQNPVRSKCKQRIVFLEINLDSDCTLSNDRFVLNGTGKWVAQNASSQLAVVLCARKWVCERTLLSETRCTTLSVCNQ